MTRPLLAEYVRAGFALVPIPLGQKGPNSRGWNERARCIDDPATAEQLDGNIGLAHAYSNTCALDIDDMDKAREWFNARGIALSELLDDPEAVRISSGRPNRAKLIYRLKKPLPSFKLPGVELRCAARSGLTIQDILPPSVHPDTGQPYEWKFDELFAHWSKPPEMPKALREVWEGLISKETKIVRPAQPKVAAPADMPKLTELLTKHDPDGPYDDWLKVGMALHHETQGSDPGLALWDQWSARGKKYKGHADLVTHWRSFRSDNKDPVTVASLRVETAASDDEFESLPPEVPGTAITVAQRVNVIGEAATLEAWRAYMSRVPRTDGKYHAVIQGVAATVACPEKIGHRFSRDDFKDQLMIAEIGATEWRPINDTDYTLLRIGLGAGGDFFPVPHEMMRQAVHYVAEANKMDTAQEWLKSLVWDGERRIEKFMPRYMGTIDAPYECSVGEYLWSALAGRIMEPGCQVDMVPILVGPQSRGKSQAVKAMVPDPNYYTEIKLGDRDDDVARKLRGTLIGEIAELRGMHTSDLDQIKAFVTRQTEKWTPKYMEFAMEFRRRLVMVGTTNNPEMLNDEEDRRWLPVRIVKTNPELIVRDRDQLWAEARELWKRRGVLWRNAEDLAKGSRDEFKMEDPWFLTVADWLDLNPGETIRSHEILVSAMGVDIRMITRAQELRITKILRALGYERSLSTIGGKRVKGWVKTGGEEADTDIDITA